MGLHVEGARVTFDVQAHDGVDAIGAGRTSGYVVAWDKFNARLNRKATESGMASSAVGSS